MRWMRLKFLINATKYSTLRSRQFARTWDSPRFDSNSHSSFVFDFRLRSIFTFITISLSSVIYLRWENTRASFSSRYCISANIERTNKHSGCDIFFWRMLLNPLTITYGTKTFVFVVEFYPFFSWMNWIERRFRFIEFISDADIIRCFCLLRKLFQRLTKTNENPGDEMIIEWTVLITIDLFIMLSLFLILLRCNLFFMCHLIRIGWRSFNEVHEL